MPAKVQIAIFNASTVLTDEEVAAVITPLQIQVSRDFAPAWGQDAELTFHPKEKTPPVGTWWIGIFDDSDQAGALGYHDLTPDGFPLAKVFAGTDKKYGMNWTVTLSHELLEMLGDPEIQLVVLRRDSNGQWFAMPYEACDAVEADALAYDINGVKVSDFVYPAWFGSGHGPYDFCGHISAPLQLLPGGYIGMWTPGGGWTQKHAENTPPRYSARPAVGSRRERRDVPKDQWITSIPGGVRV